MITIAMSEYQEAHTVSSLKGQSARLRRLRRGGGVLTEAVRRRPYWWSCSTRSSGTRTCWSCSSRCSTRGRMEDGEGREIDFRKHPDHPHLERRHRPGHARATNRRRCRPSNTSTNCSSPSSTACSSRRSSAHRGDPYYPLKDENLRKIVRLKLNKIGKRIKANHGAAFEYDDAVVDAIAARCTEVDSGARNIDNILTGTILPEVSGHVLERMAEGGDRRHPDRRRRRRRLRLRGRLIPTRPGHRPFALSAPLRG